MTPEKKKKSTGKAFGKDLTGIYKVTNIVHRYRIYRLFRYVPYSAIIGIAHFFAKALYARSKKMNLRAQRDIKAFSGISFSSKNLAHLADAVFKNIGIILFDVMLKAPNFSPRNYRKIVKLEGDNFLDDALAMGKGVILTTLHVGEFFHEVGGIIFDPRGYKLVVVANMSNQLIFENLVQVPQYKRLRVVGRASFKEIKERLVHELQKNRIVFLMHDMGGGHNLKVPFLPGKAEFLVSVPQGAIALLEETGAPIVPAITIPDGRFTRSVIRFFDPSPILEASKKYKNSPDKIFHGRVSMEINKILFPYLEKFPHCWEELITMGSRTFDIKLRFDKGANLETIITGIMNWLKGQIDGSFEPGRKDEELLAWFTELIQNFLDAIKQEQPGHAFTLQRKSFIDLGGLDTRSQVIKLLKVIEVVITRAGIDTTRGILAERLEEVNGFYENDNT